MLKHDCNCKDTNYFPISFNDQTQLGSVLNNLEFCQPIFSHEQPIISSSRTITTAEVTNLDFSQGIILHARPFNSPAVPTFGLLTTTAGTC